eukprot:TRINITY_DN15420_c0_g1_i1.p1 TRINITY_DN15420_c0_g1~~TRINITY_DN15420_c0_g1_i1.p1  ORF type:complete len:151 (-),score=21.69 TRINITY_DN15420_c0_g1_i1:160-612(-)
MSSGLVPPAVFYPVAAATVARFFLGGLWYNSPLGRAWSNALTREKGGKSDWHKNTNIGLAFLVTILTSILTSYVMVHLIHFASPKSSDPLTAALKGAFWTWFGFSFTAQFHHAIWQNRPWIVVFVDCTFDLVANLLTAAIIVLLPQYVSL